MSELKLNIYDPTENRVSKIVVDRFVETEDEFYVLGDITNGPNILDLDEGDEVVYGLLQDKEDETLFYAYEKVINLRMWNALDKKHETGEVTDKMRYFLSFREVLNLVFKENDFVGLPENSQTFNEGEEEMNDFVKGLIETGDLEEGGEGDIQMVEIFAFNDIGESVKKADL